MDNYRLYESLLSDIETTLQVGDAAIDPFNVLEVFEIQSDKDFNSIFKIIDTEKLTEKTIDCNVDDWICKLNIRSREFLNLQKTDVIVRFAWWIAFKLIYERETFCAPMLTSTQLDISEIASAKSSSYNYLRLYIYKIVDTPSKYSYNLNIMLPNGGQMIITCKNNSRL